MTVDRRKEKLKKLKKKLQERSRRAEGEIVPEEINEKGDSVVTLEKDGKSEVLEVKYLVAQTFIPNPDNKPFVIHKDGNKQNNRADNLEWCDGMYNTHYGTAIERMRERRWGNVPTIIPSDKE